MKYFNMNNYWLIGIGVILLILIIWFIATKFFYSSRLLNDILKEQSPDKAWRYSQGRLYLLISILCYYITIGVLTGKGLKPNMGIDIHTVNIIIEALQWMIIVLMSYVFGGKGLDAIKAIVEFKNRLTGNKTKSSEEENKNDN